MSIQVRNLTKTYTTFERGSTFRESVASLFHRKEIQVEALKSISFDVEPGELVGFLGPNGAGKSTTLKILTGILYPSEGEANVLGYVPWKERKRYVAHIGAVFGQKSQLIWDIPPVDAFEMNKSIYSIPDREFRKTLDTLVELLDVSHIIRKPTRQLSLGERMKCEFIMAMLHNPEIVFLDEPTIGLDVIAKEKIREFILEMNRKGVTFILTTHDLEDVERLARRVIVVNHGEIAFDNTMELLKNHLGTKKIIKLSTHTPLPEMAWEGVSITKTLSRYAVELELDLAVMDIDHFIKQVSDRSTINDLSIQDVPIESVIKDLYTAQRAL